MSRAVVWSVEYLHTPYSSGVMCDDQEEEGIEIKMNKIEIFTVGSSTLRKVNKTNSVHLAIE